MPIEGAQVERTNLLARRTREAEPREASRNRRANGRVEPKRAPPSLGGVPDGDDLPRVGERPPLGLDALGLGGGTGGGSLSLLRSAVRGPCGKSAA